jgi:hypothetical protein
MRLQFQARFRAIVFGYLPTCPEIRGLRIAFQLVKYQRLEGLVREAAAIGAIDRAGIGETP